MLLALHGNEARKEIKIVHHKYCIKFAHSVGRQRRTKRNMNAKFLISMTCVCVCAGSPAYLPGAAATMAFAMAHAIRNA